MTKRIFRVLVTRTSSEGRVTQVFEGCLQDTSWSGRTIEDNMPDFARFIGDIIQVAVKENFKELQNEYQGEIDSTNQITKVYEKDIRSNLTLTIAYSTTGFQTEKNRIGSGVCDSVDT